MLSALLSSYWPKPSSSDSFKDIIECKRTGGKFIQKKREAWKAISIKYNSSCTSGPRDADQLKTLYDNMKQKSRKDVGESNVSTLSR